VLLQLSDDDDDDDVNFTDVDNTSESDYQISSYLRHPRGFVDYQLPSDWNLGRNSYTSPFETSGHHNLGFSCCLDIALGYRTFMLNLPLCYHVSVLP